MICMQHGTWTNETELQQIGQLYCSWRREKICIIIVTLHEWGVGRNKVSERVGLCGAAITEGCLVLHVSRSGTVRLSVARPDVGKPVAPHSFGTSRHTPAYFTLVMARPRRPVRCRGATIMHIFVSTRQADVSRVSCTHCVYHLTLLRENCRARFLPAIRHRRRIRISQPNSLQYNEPGRGLNDDGIRSRYRTAVYFY